MEFPTSEFWNYSRQIWALPAIEDSCIRLQNEHGLNVNLLLFCCWTGEQQICLTDDHIQCLLEAAESWETVIKPLRESRIMMKQNLIAMPADIVEQTLMNISDMELNAEHMEQMSLEKSLPIKEFDRCDASGVECSLNNLNTYLKSLALKDSGAELNNQLSQLLSHISGDEEAVQMAMMSAMAGSQA